MSKKKYIIIINGIGGSGKDTFISFCSKCIKICNVSTVDKVKEAAKILVGWEGEKTEEARKMLSDLKRISVEYNDAPTKYILNRAQEFKNTDEDIMFVHIREKDEIDKAKKMLSAKTLFVRNDNIKQILTNDSDKNVNDYDYDYVIDNSGTLDELEVKAIEFVNNLRE